MSRFADPKATKRFVLPGPCGCPNQPHDEDFMLLRTELGAVELSEFAFLGGAERLHMLTTEWNLLDADGALAEMDLDHFKRLYLESFESLNDWLSENLQTTTLPNGSGAPSRNGTVAERGPRTRTTQKRR